MASQMVPFSSLLPLQVVLHTTSQISLTQILILCIILLLKNILLSSGQNSNSLAWLSKLFIMKYLSFKKFEILFLITENCEYFLWINVSSLNPRHSLFFLNLEFNSCRFLHQKHYPFFLPRHQSSKIFSNYSRPDTLPVKINCT